MKKIYNSYLNTIESALGKKKSLSFGGDPSAIHKGINGLPTLKNLVYEDIKLEPSSELISLSQKMGFKYNGIGKVGLHPDFSYLIPNRGSEYHNITSSFVDIKGSTNLYKDYDHEQIFTITNTIQNAAIHTCLAFGGHIQRLQGDGVFCYYGGRNVSDEVALKSSLASTAIFTYFVKNDLKNLFEIHGIEDINTRIGIDIGNNHSDVLWTITGSEQCFELTTISLHTSLAYKMQQVAKSNGINVGNHIKNKLPELSNYFLPFQSDKSIENKFQYKVYEFDWMSYLKSVSSFKTTSELNFLDTNSRVDDVVQNRINRLLSTASQINSGVAFTNRNGIISTANSGVKNEPHRFHFNPKNK